MTATKTLEDRMELANALREYDDNHQYDEEIQLDLGHSRGSEAEQGQLGPTDH